MNTDTPHTRLRKARKRAGFTSAAEASRAIGIPSGTYSGHENGSRAFDKDSALVYARRFGVSPTWILYGTEPGPATGPKLPKTIDSAAERPDQSIPETIDTNVAPLLGAAAAGVWLELDGSILRGEPTMKIIHTPHVELSEGATFALRAADNSADLIARDGDFMICRRHVRSSVPIRDGDYVVLERTSENENFREVSIRLAHIDREGITLVPAKTIAAPEDKTIRVDHDGHGDHAEVIGVAYQVVRTLK